MIVLGMFTILAIVAVPNMMSALFGSQLDVAEQEIVHALRQAQSKTVHQYLDTSWGVQFDAASGVYILFAGTGFDARDTSLDIEYALPGSVNFTSVNLANGSTGVIFDQPSGETEDFGTISIESGDGTVKTIIINQFGNVESD